MNDVDVSATDFMRELASIAPFHKGVRAWITVFPGNPKTGDWTSRPHNPTEPLPYINGSNAYYSVAAFPPTALSRSKEYPHVVLALVLDDVGEKVKAENCRDLLGDPSFIIETSPGNHQWGYLPDAPIPSAAADALHLAIKQFGASDENGLSSIRLARLPTGVNGKPEHGNFKVHMVEWSPKRRYSLAHFQTRLKVDPIAAPKFTANLTTDDDYRAAFKRGEDRYGAIVVLAARWACKGLTVDDIVSTLTALLNDYQGKNPRNDAVLRKRILKAAESAVRKFGESRRAAGKTGFHLTDLGNAERLVANRAEDIRYINGAGWATWDQHRWNTDQAESRVMVMLADVVRSMYVEASKEADDGLRIKLVKHAASSESKKSLEAAEKLARWQPSVMARLVDFDSNPLLIGLQNGVYDLERDEFRAGRRDDDILLQANVAYDPNATCPRWEKFQSEIHKDDADLVSFKQRAWGYTLSGETNEQVLFMPYGQGSNGKSTELAIGLSLFGDYARKVEPETLLVKDKRGSGASNDIARLRGARFIATVEVEDGGRMAESLVKQLTGEDTLAARFMYQEHFEFRPVGKMWIASNHKPEITGTDYAIWRRILLIPYDVKFEGAAKDPNLKQALEAEMSGVLNWMIQGYREWKRMGLAAPKAVTGATQEYRDDMDRVGNFLRECVNVKDAKGKTSAAVVYRAYVGWMKYSGLKPLSARKFHERMERDHKLYRYTGDAGALSEYRDLLLLTREYDDADM